MDESRTIANPFPGLRPFETEEYRLFFGREGQSDELLERLARTRFLAVVGTSGSGKSSLVRAGLLPAMRGGLMVGAGSRWRIAVMRPGYDPIANLACALAEKGVLPEAGGGLDGAEAEAVIEATLRRGSLGLVDAVRQARLSSHDNLLVVVDQFEELFRFRAARAGTGTGDDAAAFVKLLLEAARQREFPIYVVLTMRSDFLGDCAQFQGLPEAINDGQYLIPRMTRDERRVAITGPVAVARGRLTEPLVNRLLNDVGDNPDQLPILQHALMRTWDFWKQNRLDGEPIGVSHYEAIGTMSDALSHHADEAWGELDERQQQIGERMFKALTEKGADNREIRRPARLAEICAIVEATQEEVAAVIEVFRREGRSFLMPPGGVRLDADTIIDISHESLIRNWERLRQWVNEEAEAARMYRRLAYATEAGSYISGAFLDTALDWREQQRPNAAWAERYHAAFGLTIAFEQVASFLDASAAHRDALVAEEEKRRQEETERKRRELEQAQAFAKQQQRAKRRLALLLLFALGTAVFAFLAKTSAERAKVVAERTKEANSAYRDAIAFLNKRNVDEAVKKFTEAAETFKKVGDIDGEADSQMYLGNIFIDRARSTLDESSTGDVEERKRALADFTKGKKALEEAWGLYQNKGNWEAVLLVLNQLGDSAFDERFWRDDPKQGYETASGYYKTALDIYQQQNTPSELKGATLTKYRAAVLKLAKMAQDKHDDESAKTYRDAAINESRKAGGVQAEADTRLEIARSLGPGGQQYLDEAVNSYKEAKGQLGAAEILTKIADRRLMSYLEPVPSADIVNMREGPGLSFRIIEQLKPKTRAFILADDGKWYKVRTENGKVGFISHKIVSEVRDDKTSLKSILEDYQKALDIYEKDETALKERGNLLMKMADVDLKAKSGGDNNRALKYLNKALDAYKKLNDTSSQRQVQTKIDAINRRLQEASSAEISSPDNEQQP